MYSTSKKSSVSLWTPLVIILLPSKRGIVQLQILACLVQWRILTLLRLSIREIRLCSLSRVYGWRMWVIRMWVTVHLERIYISLSSELWVPKFATERRAFPVWLPLRNHPPVARQVGPNTVVFTKRNYCCLSEVRRRLAVSLLPTFRRNLLLSHLTEGRLKVLTK